MAAAGQPVVALSHMRLGVLADVHGNLAALEVALGELARAGVDRYLCAGDFVGYGPQPDECVERIASLEAICVAGNHDLVAIGRGDEARCGPLARTTLRWTAGAISPATRAWLERLPLEARLGDVLLTHGALGDPWRYVMTVEEAVGELDRLGERAPETRVLVVGHTHEPLAVARKQAGAIERHGGSIVTDGPGPWLLNPGSVGQSRGRRALARFMVLDRAAGTAAFGAAPYDAAGCRRALRRRGLPQDACHPYGRPWRRRAGAAHRALRRRLA